MSLNPVHAVLVEYGEKSFTISLLKDLLSCGVSAITVVDNGTPDKLESISTEDICEILQDKFNHNLDNVDSDNVDSDNVGFDNVGFDTVELNNKSYLPVRVIRSEINRGFGAAVNTALISLNSATQDMDLFTFDKASSKIIVQSVKSGNGMQYGAIFAPYKQPYVLVTNSDIEIENQVISKLVELLEANDEVGLIAPALKNPDLTVYPSARRFPSPLDAAGHAIGSIFMPNNRFSKRYKGFDTEAVIEKKEELYQVDWVSGAFFLVRTSDFIKVGGFDEGFFLYLEDVDLCYRICLAGKKVGYCKKYSVKHVGSASSWDNKKKILNHHISAYKFEKKSAKKFRKTLLPVAFLILVTRGFILLSKDKLSSIYKSHQSKIKGSNFY
jgi:N-acetylglucosaminyl-diphospho-decaprenol L-rhamnosyltransferase